MISKSDTSRSDLFLVLPELLPTYCSILIFVSGVLDPMEVEIQTLDIDAFSIVWGKPGGTGHDYLLQLFEVDITTRPLAQLLAVDHPTLQDENYERAEFGGLDSATEYLVVIRRSDTGALYANITVRTGK